MLFKIFVGYETHNMKIINRNNKETQGVQWSFYSFIYTYNTGIL